jgi:hypothetical protein
MKLLFFYHYMLKILPQNKIHEQADTFSVKTPTCCGTFLVPSPGSTKQLIAIVNFPHA